MKDPLFMLFASIVLVFAIAVTVQAVTKKSFCALCASVSASWIGFLLFAYFSKAFDPKLLAIFIGASVTGFTYFIEKKVPEHARIFKMPFFLTLALGGYALVGVRISPPVFILVMAGWIATACIYLFQKNTKIKRLATRLIECCKNF